MRYFNGTKDFRMKKYSLFLITFMLFFSSCDPFRTQLEKNDTEDAAQLYVSSNIQSATPTDTLTVVTWNIKFGGARIDFFFDCYGDRVLMTEDEVIHNLEGLAQKISALNPDILLLQEVDVQSKRSAYIDQLQWLLDHTNLNYGFYGSQWKADYVPSDGIGRMNSGNAILSKYPIKDASRIPLALIDDQSSAVQYFYLRRNILKTTISIDDQDITVFNTHTSAYATDNTRNIQISHIKTEIDDIARAGGKFILGGDFNTIPPKSQVFENFDDDACKDDPDFAATSFEKDLELMQPFYDAYSVAIPLEDYDADNASYYSFTSDKNGFWNRKLDYIFTNGTFIPSSGSVLQDASYDGMATMPLSDHAPIIVKYLK